MNEQSAEKVMNCDEMDLIEIWDRSTRFMREHKYLLTLFPALFALLGFGLSRIPSPQWESVAVIQVGSFSPAELVESTDNLIFRIQSPDFQFAALNRCDVSPGSKAANLYHRSLAVKSLKPAGMVEVRVRGFSKESALALSSATFSEIATIHSSMVSQRISVPKRRLAALTKVLRDMGLDGNAAKQIVSGDRILGNAVSAISATWPLIDQVDFPAIHPTGMISQSAADSPVSPRRSNWVVYSAVLGILLGVASGLVLERRSSRKD